MFSITLKSKAIIHLKKTFAWYRKKQEQLGFQFLDEVGEKMKSLEINPYYAIKFKNIRAINLNKFPFIILFIVSEKEYVVTVLTIFHTSQNPAKYID